MREESHQRISGLQSHFGHKTRWYHFLGFIDFSEKFNRCLSNWTSARLFTSITLSAFQDTYVLFMKLVELTV